MGWEYATVELHGVATEIFWVARTETDELASGKRLTEVVAALQERGWEVVDLTGKGAHLRRPQDAA